MNNGTNDRGSLLSGLRTGGPRMNTTNMTPPATSPQVMQQQMQMALQMQQQQALYAALQSGQIQPNQAQLLALQQSQIELQLQQIQMANLQLQEQILMQHQQAALAQQQQQHQQHRQGALRQQASSEDLAQARKGALRNFEQVRKQRTSFSGSNGLPASAASAGPNLDWQTERMKFASPPPINTQSSQESISSRATSHAHQAETAVSSGQVEAAAATRHHRKTSSLASSASNTISDSGSIYSPNKGPALVLSKPGDEFPEDDDEDEEEDRLPGQDPLSPTLAASMRSINMVGMAASGMAKAQTAHDAKVSAENAREQARKEEKSEKKRMKRHTVILSSSLPRVRTPPLIEKEQTRAAARAASPSGSSSSGTASPTTDECSSSGSFSPTSEKSDIASFDSGAGSVRTNATSASNTSPTASSFDKEDVTAVMVSINKEPKRRVFTVPCKQQQSPVLNPSAAAFAPASFSVSSPVLGNERYPSALSLATTTTPVATPPPTRIFSAPPPSSAVSSAFGTPTGTPGAIPVTIVRQPKGPAKEADMAAKNFSGLIRRKAVGALRIAASSGGRISPAASPVVESFPQFAQQPHYVPNSAGPLPHQQHAHRRNFSSSSMNGSITSPPLGSAGSTFAGFGAELAQRAMKRRSQQMALGQGAVNPGLGMY